KDDFMTDTKSKKAAPETDETGEQVVAAPQIEEPTQSLEEAVDAAAEESDATDIFFDTPVSIPGAPEASLDGAWLAFLKPNDDGALELWIAPTDGGEAHHLHLPFIPLEDVNPETGRIVRGPQWSSDGSRIALTGLHPDGDRTAVWIVPTGVSATAGEEPATVVNDATSSTSPESEGGDPDGGQEIVTPAAPEGVGEGMPLPLPKMDNDDAMRELEELEEVESAPAPDVTAPEEEPTSPAPERARMLVDHSGSDRSPRWSTDGEIIAMTSTIDGRDVISLAPVQGGDSSAIELLTWSRSNDREPVWSRDGNHLAFLRQRPDGPEHADIFCFFLETGELKNLTSDKASAVRHSLEWVPGRNLIAYVTHENDWLSISVINADNKAGWTVTRESGDKTEPRFAQNESRMVYVRTEGFTTVLCERSLHASSAVALDPGEGVVRYPRWLNAKRVAYGFSAPQRPFGFLVQDNLADADRTPVSVPGMPSLAGHAMRQPQPFEFEVGPEEMFSGMLYKTHGVAGRVPTIVYMPDGPLATRRGEFQIEEQALASTALTVLAPVIHGASGFGLAVENDLRDFAGTELETFDLAEVGRALAREEGIARDQIALVGSGYGGALALVTAGARPGVYAAVVAIDPVTDWSIELANCEIPWRNWVTDRFGMPLTDADHYTLRTPATFSAVIDAPLVLVRTASAPEYRKAQMDLFTQDLDEQGVAYEVYEAGEETLPGTLREISKMLTRRFLGGAEMADVVADLKSDNL
ncbi:MAG TPA: prolyl oligopeptidase family serine peptidase, partial [Thermomicrobiales bacterium]|nr:prolyl oligopeptidase family serine peptidase [Thermomicrobiales bacterium]